MKQISWSAFQILEESFSHIRFAEKNHTYFIDGKPAKMSVTKLIHKYETPFEKDKIAFFVAKKQGVEVMQVDYLGRIKASLSSYANDAAADADATLLSGMFYKITGSRAVYQKP